MAALRLGNDEAFLQVALPSSDEVLLDQPAARPVPTITSMDQYSTNASSG
jgi:hypothetical protein